MSTAGLREAFQLAREAQDAGLVVTMMAPHRCGLDYEFQVGLYQPGGVIWMGGTHESAAGVRDGITRWRLHRAATAPPAGLPVTLEERVEVVRAARPELGPVLGEVVAMLGGDPFQEGRHALEILEHLERLSSLSPDGDSVFIDVQGTVLTLTQTTDRDLRVAVNGAWVVAPVRERVSVDFRVAPPSDRPVPGQVWASQDGTVYTSSRGGEPLRCVACGRLVGERSFSVGVPEGDARCEPKCDPVPEAL